MSPRLILVFGLLRLGLPGLLVLTLLLFVELAPGLGEAARSSKSKAAFADARRLTGVLADGVVLLFGVEVGLIVVRSSRSNAAFADALRLVGVLVDGWELLMLFVVCIGLKLAVLVVGRVPPLTARALPTMPSTHASFSAVAVLPRVATRRPVILADLGPAAPSGV